MGFGNATIADVTTVVTKGTTPTTLGRQFKSHGIGFIKAECISSDGTLITEKQVYIDEETDQLLKRSRLQKDDVLFSIAGVIGRTALVQRSALPANTNQAIAILRPDPTKIVPKFLYYTVRAREFQDHSLGHVVQTAQANVSLGVLSAAPIWLPPIPIQRRIAGILSAYDELIENSQRRIKILESMARALYREWFVHFRFPGHESVPRVPSALGEIPKGWEVKKLGELIADHIGGGWGKDNADEDHTQPAWVIRGTDIPSARSSQVTGVPYRFHTTSNLRSRKLAAGDILFEVSGGSKGQPVGRTLLITPELLSAFDGDVICASFCKRVRPNAKAYGSELLYLSFLEGYESGEIEQYQVQSTGISNFKWTEYIARIERIIPPTPLQSHFRELVAPIFTQIATVGLKIQNLRRTRDLLLPRLLSGQIDVEALDHA